MADTMTDSLQKELKDRREKEGKYAGKIKNRVQTYKYNSVDEIMGEGVPYLAFGLTWGFLALITDIYDMWTILAVTLISLFVATRFSKKRKRQLTQVKPAPIIKEFQEEIAQKLYNISGIVIEKAKKVTDRDVRNNLSSIALTLDQMADEVERDPSDKPKVRKLANYYGDIILELIDKYLNFKKNESSTPDGENVSQSIDNIKEAIRGIDDSLKKGLDSLFVEDKMMVDADISTLDKLMKLDLLKDEGEK